MGAASTAHKTAMSDDNPKTKFWVLSCFAPMFANLYSWAHLLLDLMDALVWESNMWALKARACYMRSFIRFLMAESVGLKTSLQTRAAGFPEHIMDTASSHHHALVFSFEAALAHTPTPCGRTALCNPMRPQYRTRQARAWALSR